MLPALSTENHRRVIIINNNDSNLQLAPTLKYGTNVRHRGPPDMILHMLVMSMMVYIVPRTVKEAENMMIIAKNSLDDCRCDIN